MLLAMADPKEWGPVLWKIIHTCCENLGKYNIPLLQKDEIYIFKSFQKKLQIVIPCKVCRNHYKEYSISHMKDVPYSELKDYAKRFYFNLHNEINIENKSQTIEYEQLETLYNYKKDDLKKYVNELSALFQKYLLYKYIKPEDKNNFMNALAVLIRFIMV